MKSLHNFMKLMFVPLKKGYFYTVKLHQLSGEIEPMVAEMNQETEGSVWDEEVLPANEYHQKGTLP